MKISKEFVFAISAVLLAGSSGAKAGTMARTLFLADGGTLNGQSVNAENFWISVNPGESIAGSITVDAYHEFGNAAVVPLGYTVTWDRTTQPVSSFADIPDTGGSELYGIAISKGKPLDPGDYYIGIAFAGRFSIDQVMSGTTAGATSLWHDGNDLFWDWTSTQYQESRDLGYANTLNWVPPDYTDYQMASTWVGVHVIPGPGAMLTITLFGMAGLRRRARA